MRHYVDAAGYMFAKERPQRYNMQHDIEFQRGESWEALHPNRIIGELMRDTDGALWYGDSPSDYPPGDGSVEVESVIEQPDGSWVAT
jgi:hypothetical protein